MTRILFAIAGLMLSTVVFAAEPPQTQENAQPADSQAAEAAPSEQAQQEAAPAPGPISSKLSEQQLAKIKAGEIILKSTAAENAEEGSGIAIGMIEAPADKIMATLLDYDKYSEFMPRTELCETTYNKGNRKDSRFILDMGVTDIEYSIIHYISPDKKRITWVLDKDKKADYLTRSDGYWQLEQIAPNMTLVEYNVLIELDVGIFSGLVNSMVKSLSHDDLPNVIKRIKMRVESGNTYKGNE